MKQLTNLATEVSSHSFIGPEPALGIYAKVARPVRAGNMRSICSPYVDKDRLRVFLENPLHKELGKHSV